MDRKVDSTEKPKNSEEDNKNCYPERTQPRKQNGRNKNCPTKKSGQNLKSAVENPIFSIFDLRGPSYFEIVFHKSLRSHGESNPNREIENLVS